MGKLIKALLGLVVLLGILLGSAIFYVTSKIKPEDIKKLAIEQTEKALPGTKVNIKKVDYSIGTSFSFELEKLDIKLKEKLMPGVYPKDFFEVGLVKVKVPLWALITNGGTISINVDSPEVNYKEINKGKTNIDLALGPDKKEETAKSQTEKKDSAEDKSKSKSDDKIEVPNFVKNSKINVKFNNIQLKYSLYQSLNGKTVVSRILLKNIGLGSPSAFEISSDINVNLDKDNKFETSLLVIGDLDLKTILDRGEISSLIHVNLSNTKMSSLAISIPDVKSTIKVNLSKTGNINADVKTNIGSVSAMSIIAAVDKEKLNISQLEIKANLENAVELMPELKQSLKDIDLNQTEFFIKGKASILLKDSKLSNDISFGLTKDVNVKLVDGLVAAQGMEGNFKGTKVNVKAKTSLASGEIVTKIATSVDPLSGNFAPEKLAPIYIDVIGGNMKFTKEFIQKTIYGGDKKKVENSGGVPSTSPVVVDKTPATKIVLPVTKTTFDLRQIYIDKSEVTFVGNIHTKGNKAFSKDLAFTYDKGNGKIDFDTLLVNSKTIKNKFKFNMKGLDFSSFNGFLPDVEMLKGLEGFFNGKVNGDLDLLPNSMKYSINADVAATKAKVHGLEMLKDKIKPHLSKVKMQENDFHIPDNFDSLKVKATATEINNVIQYAEFLGPKHSLDVYDVKGNISMVNKPSRIELKVRSKNPERLKDWKEKYKTDSIPLVLRGDGFGLGLDTDALLKTISKMALNSATASAKKKIKEKVQQKIQKKLEEKVKGDAKKKFKNLFKKFKF